MPITITITIIKPAIEVRDEITHTLVIGTPQRPGKPRAISPRGGDLPREDLTKPGKASNISPPDEPTCILDSFDSVQAPSEIG